MGDAAILAEQKRVFLEKMNEKLSEQSDERSQFLTEDKYNKVCEALAGWDAKEGKEKKATQQEYPQVYAWARKYELVSMSGSEVLVFKNKAEEDDALTALDQSVKVSHQGRVFEDLHKIHLHGGHCRNRTFNGRVVAAHGKSIPHWVLDLFVQCCPTCCRRKPRKPQSAGHKPILTKGFGSRGQVDLIDFQSCADGDFKFLLTYQDHGTKLCEIIPLTSKRAAAVAFALLEIFTRIGAPAILQSDNGREFSAIAHTNKSKLTKLSDNVRAAIAHQSYTFAHQFADCTPGLQTRVLGLQTRVLSLQTAPFPASCLQTAPPLPLFCKLRVRSLQTVRLVCKLSVPFATCVRAGS